MTSGHFEHICMNKVGRLIKHFPDRALALVNDTAQDELVAVSHRKTHICGITNRLTLLEAC